MVKWFHPPPAKLKLNVGGAFCLDKKVVGIGGVVRNHNGDWIGGFINKSMAQNHTMAEVEALHTGLCLACSLKTP
ncbi:hypothetical protein RDI58_007078 [Solanum bulbocastanum]|uniref:RNase H type-1 domain-containing protein n=1 Tax=Solanum bulbocastanum TaxID=147425 RepID=A0AAN8TTD2_SOLBU